MTKHYSISIFKEYLNFSASHFVVFANGTREPLHGHNYRVRVKGHSFELNNADMVFDFLDIKPLIREICNSLDHLFLLPEKNPHLSITSEETTYKIALTNKDYFIVPKNDVKILPIENTTAERLAIYLAQKIHEEIKKQFNYSFPKIEVEVEETPGQSAIYCLEN